MESRFLMPSSTFTAHELGEYRVIVYSNGCSAVSEAQKVTMLSLPPAPGLIAGPAVVCAGDGVTYSVAALGEGVEYSWALPSGCTILSGQGTNQVTLQTGLESGTVTVSTRNSCGSSQASSIEVGMNTKCSPSGVEEQALAKSFLLFPNPTEADLDLYVHLMVPSVVSLRVFDMRGRVVLKRSYRNAISELRERIDVRELVQGLYQLQLITESGTVTKRFIKR